MSRSDLKDLGSALDEGEAALIVAAASDMSDKIAGALTNAEDVLQKLAQIDADQLSAELGEARGDADSSSADG